MAEGTPIAVFARAVLIRLRSAGELNPDELERIVTIIQNPTQFKIPNWFLNRQKDIVDGKYGQLLSNQLDSKMREDLERLKKIRIHRGLRHYCSSCSPCGGTVLILRDRGSTSEGTAHEDDWTTWKDGRCVQEALSSWVAPPGGGGPGIVVYHIPRAVRGSEE